VSRDGPVVSIRIVGGDDSDRRVDLQDRLMSFEFEDNARMADRCIIKLDNWDLEMIDDETWARGQLLEVAWGYIGNMHPPRQVVVKKVRGGIDLTVEALATSVLMDREQKTRTFNNVRRSDVVRQIAIENGFDRNFLFVENTDEEFETIVQAAETDARLLKRLANKEGFTFYVDHTGLHWHEEEFDTQPTHRLQYFTDPGRGDIISFELDANLAHQPANIRVKGRDPETKKEFEGEGSDSKTSRTELGNQIEVVDPRTGETSIQDRNATGTRHYSSAKNERQAKREADARFRKASRERIKMKLNIVGDPTLTAKRVIEVGGMGDYLSGKYYVAVSKHTITGNGYDQAINLRRGSALRVALGGSDTDADKNTKQVKEGNELFERVNEMSGETTFHPNPIKRGT